MSRRFYPHSRQRTAGDLYKEHGQQLALDFAGEGWAQHALVKLGEFIAAEPGRLFPIESFRAWALPAGLSAPASHYAWGALPALAIRAGLILWTGQYVPARSPKTHAHPVKLWRAL